MTANSYSISFIESHGYSYRAVSNLPCKRWLRPTEPRTVREIVGSPCLTNGYFLPHLWKDKGEFSIVADLLALWDCHFAVSALTIHNQ